MPEDKKNDFLTLYNKLPKSIQNFLASDEIGEIIDDALNLTKISSEQVFFSIMNLVTEILSLQLPREQFKNELQQRIKITATETQIIDQIIQTKIFNQFSKELEQYKPQSITSEEKAEKQVFSQKTLPTADPSFGPILKNKTIKPLEKDTTKEQLKETPSLTEKVEKDFYKRSVLQTTKPQEQKQSISKEKQPQKEIKRTEEPIERTVEQIQSIPEYSFPEPSKIKIEKPVNKTEEFKKVIAPKTTPSQQEKIRNRLLEAMTKKDIQPKILNEMKNVLVSKQQNKKEKENQEETPKKQQRIETNPSEVLSGEGKKFRDEEPSQKLTDKKPYILDVKLKEMKKKQEAKKPTTQEPIQYKKYKKESPFGKA
jgi:hypothetical protein